MVKRRKLNQQQLGHQTEKKQTNNKAKQNEMPACRLNYTSAPGGGGGGVLPGILGGGVPPGSSNPDPISDLNMPFSTPVFRPDL